MASPKSQPSTGNEFKLSASAEVIHSRPGKSQLGGGAKEPWLHVQRECASVQSFATAGPASIHAWHAWLCDLQPADARFRPSPRVRCHVRRRNAYGKPLHAR